MNDIAPPLGGPALLDAARSCHERGQLVEAEQLYRQILLEQPQSLAIMLQLASVCIQQRNFADAELLCKEALNNHGDVAQAHLYLGTILNISGRSSESVTHFEIAIGLDSSSAEAHYGLGLALQNLQRFDEAIACHRRALSLDCDYAEANHALALALQALGHYAASEDCCRAALEIDPEYGEAHYALGVALAARKQHRDALQHFHLALKCGCTLGTLELALGKSLHELGRYDEAIDAFKRAAGLLPHDPRPNIALGDAFSELGMIREAQACFEAAVASSPENANAQLCLVRSRHMTRDHPSWQQLVTLHENRDARPPDDRVAIHLALAKALEDFGDREGAFDHLIKGNALKRQSLPYDESAALNLFRQIASTFTPAFMTKWRGAGYRSDLPVFVLGMPRSGSTLVEQILASHPQVYAGGERLDFRLSATSVGLDGGQHPYPTGIPGATAEDLEALGRTYVQRLRTGAPLGVVRVTDKMPANFHFVGLISLALPLARIIHTQRDPIDTCLSCFSALSSSDQPFLHDLGELGRYYRGYERLMTHWHQTLPPGLIFDVRYEDLVADFESHARRIISYCGLEWSDDCLSFFDNKRPIKTASMAQVRLPIYRSSVGRWRPQNDVLRPLIDALFSDEKPGRF